MSWSGWLKGAGDGIGDVVVRPNRRNFAGKVTDGADGGGNPAVKGDKFRPERSYFSVRVAEMRLAEAGRYFTEFVPMCSCFLRYTYGRTQRTLPFVLGSETISAGLGQKPDLRAARNIQFRDMYVVRNVPVKADNLVMYTALCRFNDSGFARGLLDLFADAASTVGGAAVGVMARTGVDLTKRLASLLGTDGVETRFGMLNGSALDESGYRLFAGAASADLAGADLAMRDGQLVRRTNGVEATVDDVDYLVVALEYTPTLVDDDFAQVSVLPFHARFDEVRGKLLDGDQDGAAGALKRLLIELATSPDVTEGDRLALIASYRGAFDKWAEVSKPMAKTLAARDVSFMRDRLPNVFGKVAPGATTLLKAARTAIGDADRAQNKTKPTLLSLQDPDVVRRGLASRAAGIREALGEGGEVALFQASSSLLSASLEF